MDPGNAQRNAQKNNRQHEQVNRVNLVLPFARVSQPNQVTYLHTYSTYPTTPVSMQNSMYGVSDLFTNPQRSQPPTTSSVEFSPGNGQTQFEPSHPYSTPRMLNNFSSSVPQPPPRSNMPTMYQSRYPYSLYAPYPMQIIPSAGMSFNYQSSPDPELYSQRNGESTFLQQTTTRYVNDSQSPYHPVRYDFNNLAPPQPKRSTFLSHRHPESNQTATSSSTAAASSYLGVATSAASHYTQTKAKENEISNKLMDSAIVCKEKDFSCVVCQDLIKNMLILPCRHLCVCETCSIQVSLCPLCRQPIGQLIKVFI